ncbi:MAG: MBL fold metallo-hydrolase [Bdellovibrionaceae bacterium]|jgi:glyoxylase-like metal-dependent hydrolase (beta-lactamase superfamily II)|nr:MBL fold metallo-hydrolase [Pseudobdellovibrionaceae bacterium]
MDIKVFFHKPTFTLTYIAYDQETKDAVVIDPVIDYNANSASYSYEATKEVVEFLQNESLNLHYIIETHAHADHISGAPYVKEKFPQAKTMIHENIKSVQEVFKGVLNIGSLKTDGSQFDHLTKDNELIEAGSLKIKTIATPGHTPACACFLINDEALFSGDAIFMPDYGTGRCDFPKGSATDLYNSVMNKLYMLPDHLKYYTGHDYQPGGRELMYQSTIGASKANNVRLTAETTEAEFVAAREKRDAELDVPKLLLPSIQLNINAGLFPEPEDNGTMYLKLPFTKA